MTRIATFMVVVGLMTAGCSSTNEEALSGFGLTSVTCVKKSVTQGQVNEDVKTFQNMPGVAHVYAQLSEGVESAPRSVQITIRVMANRIGDIRKRADKLGYGVQ